jgi:EAL domain-containing protein (putative c-di-GMP-specific phosphodiesterase class I)
MSAGVLAEIAALRGTGRPSRSTISAPAIPTSRGLRQLPIDRVKLDPSLIHDIDDQRAGAQRRSGGDPAGPGVDCELVAEAVETVAQADILRAMGCETIQGFVFASR